MAFKMKGPSLYKSPAKKYKSPAKHSGAEYNAEAKAESPSGRGISSATQKKHDEGHATKWKPGTHEDKESPAKQKTATKDTKDTKASKEDPRKVHDRGTAEEAKMMKKPKK